MQLRKKAEEEETGIMSTLMYVIISIAVLFVLIYIIVIKVLPK